jgi:alginate O-acetyltransferase complex protein AlgI
MQFHTWIFLPFFLIAYTIFLVVRKLRFRNLWIVIVSYVFYGWWSPLYLVLIAYSTIIDYVALALMERSRRKKVWAAVSIANSLLLLGFFKYGIFVTENLNWLLSRIDSPYKLAMPGFLLPVGLSFYVFKSIGYVIDCYRGNVERERSFIRHAAFVSFFPILVAGPIERAANILPQFRRTPNITGQDIADGLSLFIIGLFKKLALADALALYVNKVYAMPQQFHSPALILATFAFAWQIYFDFSGYSDMARGLAQAMGFRIMLNFNHPYLATGIGDFWRRWHISLSTWFRDYLYIPLGGNRKGKFDTYRNLFITMVVSGLWHGAAWTFVIWGAFHAFGMMLTRELERSTFYNERFPKLAKQVLVFAFVTFAWIFFRAESLDSACLIIGRIFTSGSSDPAFPLLFGILIAVVWLYQFACESRVRWVLEPAPFRIAAITLMIFYLMVFAGSAGQTFIYNQF